VKPLSWQQHDHKQQTKDASHNLELKVQSDDLPLLHVVFLVPLPLLLFLIPLPFRNSRLGLLDEAFQPSERELLRKIERRFGATQFLPIGKSVDEVVVRAAAFKVFEHVLEVLCDLALDFGDAARDDFVLHYLQPHQFPQLCRCFLDASFAPGIVSDIANTVLQMRHDAFFDAFCDLH
jgi:hypothetical protein